MPKRPVRLLSLAFALGGLLAAFGCSNGNSAANAENNAGSGGMYRWHTFLGAVAAWPKVAVDASGNIYVAGESALWEGPNGEPPIDAPADGSGMFIAKLDPEGGYLWHTFYDVNSLFGTGYLAVDGDDAVTVTGRSFEPWDGPGGEPPLNAYPQTDPLAPVSVVVHLQPDGSYGWHAFYGSLEPVVGMTPSDMGNAVAATSGGDLLVTGGSMSWEGPDGQAPLHSFAADAGTTLNLFVLALGSDGTYLWHTFYPVRYGFAIAERDGAIYVAGNDTDLWYGPGGEAPIGGITAPDPANAFVVIGLDADGEYTWHAYHGQESTVYDLVAAEGGPFLAGTSYSGTWYGPGGTQPLHGFSAEGADAFALALDADGGYRWHTFYGCPDSSSEVFSLAAGTDGTLYVPFYSLCPWDGPNGESPLTPFPAATGSLAILALLPDGDYAWHTFFHAGEWSGFHADSAFAGGALYTVGQACGLWLGPNGESPLHDFTGGADDNTDLFILKLVP